MKLRGNPDKLYLKEAAHSWAKGLYKKGGMYVFHPYTLKDFKFDYDNRRSTKQASRNGS